ncbi:MAG: PAQR family membrane homeostasis protein TrhA [Lawsonibacter sp.]|jgi:hemolysin III
MRSDAIILPGVPIAKPRQREVRDPYDGLRPWSAITHGIGAVLAVAGTVALVFRAVTLGEFFHAVLFLIYGISMACLYTASTLYHCKNTSVWGRIALRKYDHCSIYLLIAGSYTPICLTALKNSCGPQLLILVWSVGLLGIFLTLVKLTIPRWLTSTIYLFMGWLALLAIVPLYRALPIYGFFLLVSGGLLYTVGGVLYAVKWPGRNNPRFGCHEIFHVFILLGSVVHFVLMYQVIALL